MKKREQKSGKKLHLIPLILGVYAAFLGFGLILAGITGGAAGTIRIIIGLVMTAFGLYGIWDGLRDLLRAFLSGAMDVSWWRGTESLELRRESPQESSLAGGE